MNNEQIVNIYRENGFAVIPNFLTDEEVDALLVESENIVRSTNDQNLAVFKGSTKEANCDDTKYFLESGDKIRFFYEPKAFDENGQLIASKEKCLNKIGHALHCLNPIYKSVTFSDKVKEIVKAVGFKKPLITQSMIIFKNPAIGGEVLPHQDASYLYTTPEIKLMGFWLALSDAVEENGCLWFIPKSHKDQLYTRFIRKPEKSPPLIYTKTMPEFNDNLFVAAPVKKGSCILIDGLVIHKSEANKSMKPRPIYTFHIYDSFNTTWAPDNWLQPTDNLPFSPLF
ncbi:hypothetical protein B4U79_15623 [Dinothrombium tinctorium]|uniref:Phytanoyl-CoA dioxygenase domain-containing protein 1-like protein n=1 Tax=Dinothrombium tinctorium TaxID=1965070 RepID=A0A3S3PUF1_9ACAR|nr:hypothetical protein B4U79_08856 [Dinothrombium tinctorium]RWS08355.1 hypothetical protein B4U79_05136 [Dinothrombium tinctorium]RWS14678.1 hypothetical protein B4U79_15623 [Dinothrombium tinctorium]